MLFGHLNSHTQSSQRSNAAPLLCACILFLAGHGLHCYAQTKPATATIHGHVIFADTGRPARFATVYLKSVTPPDNSDDFFTVLMDSSINNMQQKELGGGEASELDSEALKSAHAASSGFLSSVADAMLSATIGPTGDYSFTSVPPGTYYLHVKTPGYVDSLAQFSRDELASRDPAVRRRVNDSVKTVTIVGGEDMQQNLSLERGASISGQVLYDDGSPATGWRVRAIAKRRIGSDEPTSIFGIDLSQAPIGEQLDRSVTDDKGHFRIAGLASGTYVLEARLATAALDRQPFVPVSSSAGSFLSILGGIAGMSGLRLTVYSGSTNRLHDADEIKVRGGEESSATDMTVALSAEHSITGFVVARGDGHALNNGTVELIAQDKEGHDDPSLKFSAPVQGDGTFRFDCVPAPGSYTLRALHASDATSGSSMKLLGSLISERKVLRNYAPSPTVLALADSDLTAVKLTVDDLAHPQHRSRPILW